MPRLHHPGHFRDRHYLVVVLLVLIAGGGIAAKLGSGWQIIGQAQGTPTIELRLDPNTASAQELAAIPGVGPRLAERIVAYRDRQLATGHRPAFADLNELDRVDGVGKATLEAIGPSLSFGDTKP